MNLECINARTVRTILQFSIPSIIAMVLTSLITIVDGFFIGNYVGKEGIAAVNLGLPILYIYLAIGLMISVGGIAIAGMTLGAQELKKSNAVFNQTIITTIIVSTLLSLCVWLFFTPIMGLMNLNAQVANYFYRYYSIMILAYPVMTINSSFGMFIRGEGKPQLFMIINLLIVLCNILLDYLFIRWLHLGIEGIASASLISLIIGLVMIIFFFQKRSSIYKFSKFNLTKQCSGILF